MATSEPIYSLDLASRLPEGWSVKRFEDMVFYQEGPGIRNWQYSDNGVPFVNIRCLVDGKLDREAMSKVSSKDAYEKYPHFLLQADDYVVSSSGTLGRIATVRTNDLPCLLNTSVIRMRPKYEALDRLFLKYFLHSNYYQSQILSFATGSAQLNYGPYHLKQMYIVIPPIAEQKHIAKILGSLDDKIELNRKMNATLEQMARALFQSWFVDFDPVHAKAAGRQPIGMDKATADLFPDSFVDSELGKIPDGWRIGSIYDIANVIYGAPFASSLFNSEKVGKPLIRIRDLTDESPAVFTTEVHPKGYLLQPGDIAVGMDGEFRAYLWAGVESWLNQRVCVFAPKPGYSAAFVRNSIIAPLAQVEATETATTVIHLGKNDIDRFTVIIPGTPVAEAFKRCCQPLYEQIVANKQKSRTLTKLRDTLLPKLLSGELSVK